MPCGTARPVLLCGWRRGADLNYYEHHIGDYDADTAHLSWFEDMAYTRLMRLYYRKELPVPGDVNEACRLVRAQTKEQRQAVETVLREFFVLGADGWRQKRCDADIDRYQKKAEHNRVVGKLGGRPPKKGTQQKPSGLLPGSETEPKQNPLQSPDTTNSEPNGSGGEPPAEKLPAGPQDVPAKDIVFALGVPFITAAGVKESNARSFLAMQCRKHTDTVVARAIEAAIAGKAIEPISWIQDHLSCGNGGAGKASKHAGFDAINYREGVESDGSFA